MFENECWWGRVCCEYIFEVIDWVEFVVCVFEMVVNEDFMLIIEKVVVEKKIKVRKCELEYDMWNNVFWMCYVLKDVMKMDDFIYLCDRFGKEVVDRWMTVRVEFVLDDYRVVM